MKRKLISNFPSPLHLACGNDELRPAMNYIKFENGYAYATDAHILVRQSFDMFGDTMQPDIELLNGKYLHKAVFERILKHQIVFITPEGIEAVIEGENKVLYKFSTAFDARPDEPTYKPQRYPNVEVICQQAIENKKVTSFDYNNFGWNPRMLSRLMRVMYTESYAGFHLNYGKSQQRAILVTASDYDHTQQMAVIMPIMVS